MPPDLRMALAASSFRHPAKIAPSGTARYYLLPLAFKVGRETLTDAQGLALFFGRTPCKVHAQAGRRKVQKEG